jgi:DNA polymerase-1
MKKVGLIDISGFIYRAFYAVPKLTHKDKEVGALYGFCVGMQKIQSLFKDTNFIAAFDSSKKTFRNEIYAEYKANRKATPEELLKQIPMIKEACKKFGFQIVEKLGFEADDIIASLAQNLSTTGNEVIVISSDKDLMQLLNISGLKIYDPVKREYITDTHVLQKFGVPPNKLLDVMALIGDSSDNVPGVSKIGPKTAALLINEFGSLDNLISKLNTLPKNNRNEILKSEIHMAVISKELIMLKYDVPIDLTELNNSDKDELNKFFLRYGFKSLVKVCINFFYTTLMPFIG